MARRNWMEDYLAGRPDEMHTEEPKASAAGTNPYPYVKTDDKPVMPDDYGAAYREAVRRYTDMAPFSYDHTSDPRWQAYKKEYAREGARATEDTLGRYAAMTGGAPSTAAVTAAGQAGDYYAAKLADKIPELYDLAYAMYTGEADRLYRQLSALQAARGGELDRYRTQLSQWNADRDRADALGQQAWERGYRERSYADSRADKAAADAYQYAMATGDYSYLRDLGYDTSFLERQRDKEMAELDKPELSLAEVNAAIKAGNTAPNVLKAWEYYYGAPYEGATGGYGGYGGYGGGEGNGDEKTTLADFAGKTPTERGLLGDFGKSDMRNRGVPGRTGGEGGAASGDRDTMEWRDYNRAGSGILEQLSRGNVAAAEEQADAIWDYLTPEQRENLRNTLAMYGIEIED